MPLKVRSKDPPCSNHAHAWGVLVAAMIGVSVCGSFSSGASMARLKKAEDLNSTILHDLFKPRVTGPDLMYPGRPLGFDYGIGIYHDTNMNFWDEDGHPAVFLGCEDLKQYGRGVTAMFSLTMFFLFVATLGHVQHWSGVCEGCSMWMVGIGHTVMSICLLCGFGLVIKMFYEDWHCDIPNGSVAMMGQLGLTASARPMDALNYHVDSTGQTVATLSIHEHFDLSYALIFMVIGCALTLSAGILAFVFACGCCGDSDEKEE